MVGNHDDIKRCYANNKPIDFVVDDLSELAGYERDSGESGAKCIGNDGKFDGHYCRGLTKDECFELERLMLKELKTHGWAGDDDLVDWDEKAGACELNASQFANNLNKAGKYTAVAGLTIAGVFTGGSTTALAITLMSVELAGMAGEIVTERQKELLPQRWADAFLAKSTVCKQAACAENTLRENMGKIAQASDMLNRDVLKQVDDELARLAELLPDDRLNEILQNPKAPGCWETWECQEKLFTVMQMASLGVAVGKGLINLPKVLARKFGNVAAKTAAAGAAHADDVAKAASKADDIADAVWDATAKRFRDPKTGRFVSGYTSYTDELAELGIKRTVVNGKDVYKDIKTGAELSDVQVLNRIPTSMNDDFAKIGVRQIEQADGTLRYLDISAGGGNKFISEAEVLKRIDDMPSAAVKAADNTADVARTGNKAADVAQTTVSASKADDVADVAKQLTPTTPRSAVRSKLGDNINSIIDDVKAGKTPDVMLESGALSKEEWKVLKEELAREGMDLREQGTLHYLVEKPKISIGAKAGDAVQTVGVAANKADDAIDAAAITRKLNSDFNFDGMIRDVKNGSRKSLSIPKESLTEAQWKVLQESLRKEGLEMMGVPGNASSYGMEQVMIAKRGAQVDGMVFGGSKIVNKADDVVDVTKGASSGARTASVTTLRQQASKSFDQYLSEVKNSTAGKGAKLPKNRLNDAGWTELNKSLATENVQLVEITENGQKYMQFVRANHIDDVADAARVVKPVQAKTEKIAAARKNGNLGYHGTDADISMDDVIRSSANSSEQLGGVGYGIAKDYDAAEKYAVKRLIERQNPGKIINFFRENDMLVINSSEPINLGNKTGYVYTTAKESSVKWNVLRNSYVGSFDAAQMPHAVEILDKKIFNLDDLIRQGKVKIISPGM
ncbi:MAG: hypothetical protein MJ158_00400 [Alphaproteobacteria bacterium]|nr:hypothetical protein [Alphaproteobacteria bacterium]